MTAIEHGAAAEPDPVDRSRAVAVVGAGTMGQGIAQVALAAGHPVLLFDAVEGRAAEAVAAVAARWDRLVEKGRTSAAERDAARARLRPVDDLSQLADAALVVEAVVERLSVKQELFTALEQVVAEDCLLATNTSSLSVTAVAGPLKRPGRLVGLHFFNPAPLLPLVEVVSGFATQEECAARAWATAAAWGKTPVHCADTPGFVVNRVARPFYAEAFALHEERAADPATIDAVLRECGGFPMGPFELTDLIGQDVNEAVTRSVWESFFHSPKFTPSLAQRRLVEAGLLGRKSGRGWYDHAPGAERRQPHTAPPADPPPYVVVHGADGLTAELLELIADAGISVRQPADPRAGDGLKPSDDLEPSGGLEPSDGPGLPDGLELPGGGRLAPVDGAFAGAAGADVVRFDLALDYRTATRIALAPAAAAREGTLREAIGLFQALGKEVSVIDDAPGMIVARTVAMLIDVAADAVARGVATEGDVDTAMRLGVNHPLGPFEWDRRLPGTWAHDLLTELHGAVPTGRYAPGPALGRRTFDGVDGEGADA
ncbi:3-hydroxyacyl-CoA dehydrogenase [Streptomyces sp. NPDC020412]|uniref:3-hydroxyacyl-CoA dehydrogenase n=1 Tax=Streptomyces sp. NPDC020412 TaxID=3365073 RepID=UPI00378ABC66